MEHPELVHEITCKSAFRKLSKRIGPYRYDMNVYRGCAHHCTYCYALYSQRYLAHSDFYHDIYVKTNILEQLEKQLASPHWQHELINIGSVSDSYQPAEEQYGLMRGVLKLLIKYRNPCIIATKSRLILRDLDLIKELADLTYVNIAATITTLDERISTLLEPHALSPIQRGEVLAQIKQHTKAITGMHVMPVLPYLNDDEASLHALCAYGVQLQVDYATFGLLHLRGETKQAFFATLREHFPHLSAKYRYLYRNGKLDPAYQQAFYERLTPITTAYGINTDYMQYVLDYEQRQKMEQLSLW